MGFNEPLMRGHVGLMAQSLTASAVLQELHFLNVALLAVTVLALLQPSEAGSWQNGLRLIRGHSVLFAVSWVALLGCRLAFSYPFNGECIVEGELSFAALAFVWFAAWLPIAGFAMARRLLSQPKLNALSPTSP